MTEMMKRNQFARAQLQAQGQQPFPGMNIGIGQIQGNQPQSFHDNSGQPSHIQPGFPNMSALPNGNMNSAAMPARNPMTETERQIGLLLNANPSNGPGHLNKFPQQSGQQGLGQQQHQGQQQSAGLSQSQQNQMREAQQNQFGSSMNEPSPAGMFSSPGMNPEALRRPSPHPNMGGHPTPGIGQSPSQAAQPGVGVSGGGPMQQGRQLTLIEKNNIARTQLAQIDHVIQQWQQKAEAARGTPMESQFMAKAKEMQMRKENFKMMWYVACSFYNIKVLIN